MFSPELPAKLNHAEFRGNNLLFDFERPVDLLHVWDPHCSRSRRVWRSRSPHSTVPSFFSLTRSQCTREDREGSTNAKE